MGAIVCGQGVSREEHWRRHVAAWRTSGLIQAEYCRGQGLNAAQFSWWKHELARRDEQQRMPAGTCGPKPPLFVPVQIATRSDAAVCEIVLRSGQCLRVKAGTDAKWVAEVARCLEAEAPC